jgi:hypothetical protein
MKIGEEHKFLVEKGLFTREEFLEVMKKMGQEMKLT